MIYETKGGGINVCQKESVLYLLYHWRIVGTTGTVYNKRTASDCQRKKELLKI